MPMLLPEVDGDMDMKPGEAVPLVKEVPDKVKSSAVIMSSAPLESSVFVLSIVIVPAAALSTVTLPATPFEPVTS